jgi:hypothetical protein
MTDAPDIPLGNLGQPDLQKLVERAGRRHAASIGEVYEEDPFKRPAHQGGYQHITPAEWAEYDRLVTAWRARQRDHQVDAPSSDPEAVCICGRHGVYSRRRQSDGQQIWRCEEHRAQWPAANVTRERAR